MSMAQAALEAARGYLRTHPEELGRAVRNAFGLRLGVPLVALRWLGRQAEKSGKVSDLKIDSVPPGLRASASLDLMGTPLRASAVVYIDRIVFNEDELTVAVRLEEGDLRLNGDAETPVAALIKSGALDLSKPGTLVGYMPKRSPVIAEARDNRIVLDLMRDPKIGKNPLVRSAVAVLTSFVTLKNVEADEHHLDIGFRALPVGVRGAARSVRSHVVLPSIGRFLPGMR
ncbi:MAG TPA: hypothetical protein RMI62_29290 [Polyangiaceae bacterium LLY-WYZ-15_(1-7)]|nr:hypothetical protein [Polyangiaceae bacterium LLY-WYZ-15_(1-7)]